MTMRKPKRKPIQPAWLFTGEFLKPHSRKRGKLTPRRKGLKHPRVAGTFGLGRGRFK